MTWSGVTWDAARAGGFAAYVLLSAAVAVGLVLRNRWQTARWPRFVTNELHGYLSLLALIFVGIHVLAVLVDPFTRFGLVEVLVPLASHYRPLWMGLGVVALYLLLAVWATSRVRARLGIRAWRAIHYLSYGVYAAATVHGLGTGSDTRAFWAPLLYASSVLLVGGLAARRLLVPANAGQRPQPALAALGAVAVAGVVVWTALGPLAPHWGARAGGGPGKRATLAARVAPRRTSVQNAASGTVATPFSASFAGRLTVRPPDESGHVTLRIDGALSGGTRDHLEIYLWGLPLENGGVQMQQSRVRMGAATPLYQGQVVGLQGSRIVALVRSKAHRLRLAISLNVAGDGRVSGSVRGSRTQRSST